MEVSSPKVGYPHGTLRLLKHQRHLAIIVVGTRVGKGTKVAEGISGPTFANRGTAGTASVLVLPQTAEKAVETVS